MARFRGGVSGAAGGRNRLRTKPAGGGAPGSAPASLATRPAPAPGGTPAYQKLGYDNRRDAAAAMQEAEGQGSLKSWLRSRLAEAKPEAEIIAAAPSEPMRPVDGDVVSQAMEQVAAARPTAGPEMQTLPAPAGPETGAGSPASLATRPAPAAQPPGFGTGELQAQPFYPEPAPDGDVKPFIPPGLQGGPAGPQPSFRQPNPEAIRPILQRLMAGRGGAGDFAGGVRERQPLAF